MSPTPSPTPMRVLIVGPGRVGTTLGAALARSHRVIGAAGGSQASRERFAARIAGARTAADPADLVGAAQLVVLATPDDALVPVVTDLVRVDALGPAHRVVHVSGAQGLAPLRRAELAGARIAACHPAQTIPSPDTSPEMLVGVPWAVTAGSQDRAWARCLVRDLGGDPHDVDDDVRPLYHAALVVGSNAAGAVTAVARQLLLAARVEDPAAFLRPLIQASVTNVLRDGAAALTGPVVRGDAGTVARHVEALATDLPHLADAYGHLTEVVLAQVRATLTDDQITALRAAVHREGPA
ncbi:MAG TPA: Rossmann-like and DUF2520 domain-containing protein [Nitriliruptorales bacterium]